MIASARNIGSAVVLAATVLALVGPGVAPAKAAPVGPTLTASATFPGTTGVQSWRSSFGAVLEESRLQVVGRPDGATLVVEDPTTRTVVRHHRRVTVSRKACGRATVHLRLVPDDGIADIRAVARTLLPEAQRESYVGATTEDSFLAMFTAGHPSSKLVFRMYEDVRDDEAHPAKRVWKTQKWVTVTEWREDGLRGWSVVEQTVTRLRNTGVCRYDPTLPDSDAADNEAFLHGIDPLRANLLILGGQDA